VLRARLACIGVCVALAAAGCGGGGAKSHLYTLTATQACLRKAGFETAVVQNFYLAGKGGNLRVKLASTKPQLLNPNAPRGGAPSGSGDVFLVFGRDSAAARATQRKGLTLASESLSENGLSLTRAAIEKSMGVSGNVFYYSATQALSSRERATITRCLH
jgi:hypothetical protein